MSKKNQEMVIPEPIDYEALSAAYRQVNWKWGFKPGRSPNPKDIQEVVERFKQEVLPNDSSGYRGSGGITVKKSSGQIDVLIHISLYQRYQYAKEISALSQTTPN